MEANVTRSRDDLSPKLRTHRNDTVEPGSHVTKHILSTTTRFWATCVCQLGVIATREHQQLSSAIRGAMLHVCIELLEHEPRGSPGSTRTSPGQSPESLALACARTQRSFAHRSFRINNHLKSTKYLEQEWIRSKLKRVK